MTSIDKVLKAVSPNANAQFIAASVNAGTIMAEFKITSPNAQAQIIGQMAVESGGFKTFVENLNYSAARLTQVWPSRFPNMFVANEFANNPKALANKVYNGRMGNRPGSDDGWNYRGSGPLQHTGATEFQRVERRTGLLVTTNPSLLRTPQNADAMWRAACSYFVDRGALAAADRGDTMAVTLRVNGGQTGLADRKIMVQRAAHALMGETIVISEPTRQEQSESDRRKATQATVGAPAGGGAAGGATGQADKSPHSTAAAIGVGLVVFAILAVVAIIFWRKHFATKAELETRALKAIDDRLAMSETPVIA